MLIRRDLHKRNASALLALPALLMLPVLLLTACSAAPPAAPATPSPTWSNVSRSADDTAAFATLSEVAPAAARLPSDSTTEGTECWTPSEHLFRDPAIAPPTVFRVLCRVHYRLDAAARYTDVVCIGDFAKQPMLDHCYIWKPHLGEATFEDGAALASPPPTPLS
jgi:hypothetical protein